MRKFACAACHGTGRMFATNVHGEVIHYRTEPCGFCSGTGDTPRKCERCGAAMIVPHEDVEISSPDLCLNCETVTS